MPSCLPGFHGGIEFPVCSAAGSIVSLTASTLCYGLMERVLLESSTGCVLDLPVYYKSETLLDAISCIYYVNHSERLYCKDFPTKYAAKVQSGLYAVYSQN